MVLPVYGVIGYVLRKLARTVAGIVAGGAIVAAGPGAAQAAQSPAAVPCSASAHGLNFRDGGGNCEPAGSSAGCTG